MREADVEERVTEMLIEHGVVQPTQQHALALIRMAYGRGYTDALADPEPNPEQAARTATILSLRVPVT